MQQVSLNGPGVGETRSCTFDSGQPVKVQVFVQGPVIACFINDRCALTCRVPDSAQGTLSVMVGAGTANLLELQVKTRP